MSTPSITYRDALLSDEDRISSLDSSFTTTTHQRLTSDPCSFMEETPAEKPIHKIFPDSDSEDEEEEEEEGEGGQKNTRTLVAVTNQAVIGVVIVKYQAWNKRLVIQDIKVDPTQRGQGIGRGLIDRVMELGREFGANHVWLEVSNINTPAIKAYEATGFKVIGYDEWLYEGTESAGEWAIFMARRCS